MKITSVFSLALLAMLCVASAPLTDGQTKSRKKRVASAELTQTQRRRANRIYASLFGQLRAQGAKVKPSSERVSQPFFSVKGRILMIDGQAAQVFAFANAATAAAEARRVGARATTSAAWIAPPHFFHGGKLIVLYVGGDQSILKILTAVLGPQFAGQ